MTTLSFGQLEDLWVSAGGNPQTKAIAAAIAMAESGGRTTARNVNNGGSIDYGLWQRNSYWNGGSPADYDPMLNARYAIQDSKNGTNWRLWCTAYSDGACGKKGGTYLGSGSPYMKYLRGTTNTDFRIPNPWIPNPFGQIPVPDIGKKLAQELTDLIFRPFLRWAWWGSETVAGIVLMVVGLFVMLSQTRMGKAAISAGETTVTRGVL